MYIVILLSGTTFLLRRYCLRLLIHAYRAIIPDLTLVSDMGRCSTHDGSILVEPRIGTVFICEYSEGRHSFWAGWTCMYHFILVVNPAVPEHEDRAEAKSVCLSRILL